MWPPPQIHFSKQTTKRFSKNKTPQTIKHKLIFSGIEDNFFLEEWSLTFTGGGCQICGCQIDQQPPQGWWRPPMVVTLTKPKLHFNFLFFENTFQFFCFSENT
jgi:hypothetical protein